jgi:putative endonuclease
MESNHPACVDDTTVPATKSWWLYLLECANGAFYAGITNDLAARMEAHRSGRGAKYTRSNPPVRIVASCPFPDRSSASRAEWEVKRLPRAKKTGYVHQRLLDATATVPC